MQTRLEQILENCRKYTWQGEGADYIPELAKSNGEEIGIYVATDHGDFYAGDWEKQFTIQSIVKTIGQDSSKKKCYVNRIGVFYFRFRLLYRRASDV